MQQDQRGGGGDQRMQEMKGLQQQDRRGKLHLENHQQAPPQQPQKCPRCDSLNTKFCYYNNYSLSQPRYFCKTCRRYWTQGGTLRNVPVGGGCRKGKRSKKPSSSTDHNLISNPSSISTTATTTATQNLSLRNKGIESTQLSSSSPLLPPMAAAAPPLYYPSGGGGFLSSLAAFQPFNQTLSISTHDHFSTASNLALLQGFSLPSITPHQHGLHHHHQQQEVFNLGSRDPLEENIIQSSNRPSSTLGTAHHHQDQWPQSFNSNNNSITIDHHHQQLPSTGYWSSTIPTTSTTIINNNLTTSGPSLNPTHHWSDLPGFGPPPTTTTTTTTSSPPSFL